MDDAQAVRLRQALENATRDCQRPLGGDPVRAVEDVRHRVALQVLHGHEEVGLEAIVEDADGVRVLELAHQFCLTTEAGHHLFGPRRDGTDGLDCNHLARLEVLGLVDDGITAPSELAQNLVAFGDNVSIAERGCACEPGFVVHGCRERPAAV